VNSRRYDAKDNLDSVPGLDEVRLAFRLESAVGNHIEKIVAPVPPAARIFPRIAAVAVTASTNDLGDEDAVQLQHSPDFTEHAIEVENMIKRIRIDAIDGMVRILQVMKVAYHDKTVVDTGVQVDADGEGSPFDECLAFAAATGAEAQDRPGCRASAPAAPP